MEIQTDLIKTPNNNVNNIQSIMLKKEIKEIQIEKLKCQPIFSE